MRHMRGWRQRRTDAHPRCGAPSLARSMALDDPGGGEPAVAAALELTFLSLDGIKTSPAEAKHYYAVAWLDPGHKQQAPAAGHRPSSRQRLYFPLSRTTLADVSSCVTVEVLCPSCLPFHPPRLVGSAQLPISSVRFPAGEAVALPLRRPSGRVRGSLLVSARILWDIGFDGGSGGFSAAEDDFPGPEFRHPMPKTGELAPPSAPPLPEGVRVYGQGSAWLTLVGGAVAAATAVLVGVACRRLNV